MGRTFVVEFEQPNPDYYFCKLCRTHIALEEDFNCILPDTEPHEGVFYEAVNVQVDEPVHHRQVGDHTVADIYCIKCGDILGWKYIKVGGEQSTIQNGNVKIILEKLLLRHGDEILDAVTKDPVPENP